MVDKWSIIPHICEEEQEEEQPQDTKAAQLPMDTIKHPTLRELMPAGFIKELSRRTGCKSPSRLSTLVSLEGPSTANEWGAIEQLARETNPEGFEAWQAAHAQAA